MGLSINGQWRDHWYDTPSSGGRFLRKDSAYRNWVTVDGAPGPTGHGGFPAELGRYHLYVSLACPGPIQKRSEFKPALPQTCRAVPVGNVV